MLGAQVDLDGAVIVRHVPDLDPLSAAPVQRGGDVGQGAEVDAVLLPDSLGAGEHEVAQLVGADPSQRGRVFLPRLERGASAEHAVAVGGLYQRAQSAKRRTNRSRRSGPSPSAALSAARWAAVESLIGPYRRPAASRGPPVKPQAAAVTPAVRRPSQALGRRTLARLGYAWPRRGVALSDGIHSHHDLSRWHAQAHMDQPATRTHHMGEPALRAVLVSTGRVSRCPSMTNIFSRALGATAITAVATLAAASPAVADPSPGGLIGSQLGVIGLDSQNSAVNNGNTGEAVSHSVNSQNSAQQVVTDAQSIDIAKHVDVLEKPLILV